MTDARAFLEPLRRLQASIRDEVVAACENSSVDDMSRVADDVGDGGDTIFAIDRISEDRLVEWVDREIASSEPVVLIAEGLVGGERVLPTRARAEDARFRLIVDPIDGTRGLMYGKRSGWILAGVAPNLGAATSMRDIEVAIQTEIPTTKQHLSDVLWAVRGGGAQASRFDRTTGESSALALSPSRATSPAQGFAMIARFFPGGRDVLAAVDDELAAVVAGPPRAGRAICFEDQYVCSGGQLYELCVGHDRFVADLRPLLASLLGARGWPPPLCCHPYDLATELIAREAGVIVTDPRGAALSSPLDIHSNVAWIGYANAALRATIETPLRAVLARHGLLAAD